MADGQQNLPIIYVTALIIVVLIVSTLLYTSLSSFFPKSNVTIDENNKAQNDDVPPPEKPNTNNKTPNNPNPTLATKPSNSLKSNDNTVEVSTTSADDKKNVSTVDKRSDTASNEKIIVKPIQQQKTEPILQKGGLWSVLSKSLFELEKTKRSAAIHLLDKIPPQLLPLAKSIEKPESSLVNIQSDPVPEQVFLPTSQPKSIQTVVTPVITEHASWATVGQSVLNLESERLKSVDLLKKRLASQP